MFVGPLTKYISPPNCVQDKEPNNIHIVSFMCIAWLEYGFMHQSGLNMQLQN